MDLGPKEHLLECWNCWVGSTVSVHPKSESYSVGEPSFRNYCSSNGGDAPTYCMYWMVLYGICMVFECRWMVSYDIGWHWMALYGIGGADSKNHLFWERGGAQ